MSNMSNAPRLVDFSERKIVGIGSIGKPNSLTGSE
jgi:hypothetical protein